MEVGVRYEDQLNSCVGQADENGWRTMQNGYLAFGEAMQSRVLYDGAVSRLSSVAYDGLGLTTITLASADLSTDLLNGALLFLARPGYSGDRHMEAVVVDTTSTTIVIADAAGAMSEALGPEGQPIEDFLVLDFNDSKQANAPTYQTHGRPKGANPQNACHFAGRTSAPSYASSQTTFTDADADDNGGGFASWMIGALLVPDVNIGAPLIITGATATTLTVAGDARGVAANGSQYIVYAAPFTDPVRGTWQTDPHKGGTRYLWAGYRYQPPQMGFWVDPPGAPALGVYGAATGVNRLGQYYCWNRNYDINTGRWTTPDPVATPWWNLQSYSDTPVGKNDPSGMAVQSLATAVGSACAKGVATALAMEAIASLLLYGNISVCRAIASAIAGCVGGVGGIYVKVVAFLTGMLAKHKCNEIARTNAEREAAEEREKAAALRRRNAWRRANTREAIEERRAAAREKYGYPDGGAEAILAERNIDACRKSCDDYIANERRYGHSKPPYAILPHPLSAQGVDWEKCKNDNGELDWDGWKKCCYEECFKHYKPAGAGSLDDVRCVARKHREARGREAADQDQ